MKHLLMLTCLIMLSACGSVQSRQIASVASWDTMSYSDPFTRPGYSTMSSISTGMR